MPFTLAHPVAIFPLRRVAYLATIPLLLGSLIPDFMRMVPASALSQLPMLWRLPGWFAWMPESHSLSGTVLTDLPSGYLLLLVLIVFRAPLLSLLWDPHRAYIRDAFETFLRQPQWWLIAIPSVLVGSWTHVAWDGLTHDSWVVNAHISPLQNELFPGNDHPLPIYKVLQYVSSVLGVGATIIWYRSALAKSAVYENSLHAMPSKQWRKVVLGSLIAASLVVGVVIAMTRLPAIVSFYPLVSVISKAAMVTFGFLYVIVGLTISVGEAVTSRLQRRHYKLSSSSQ